MIAGRGIERFLDVVCEILAYLTILFFAVMIIVDKTGIISNEDTLLKLSRIKEISIFAVLILSGLEAALKRNVFVFLFFLLICGVVVWYYLI